MVDWWHKLRRIWARVKTRKTGNVCAGGGAGAAGLLKLREDVRTCGYQDVEVMWNMLSRIEVEHRQQAKRTKQPSIWRLRLFFWSHRTITSSSSAI